MTTERITTEKQRQAAVVYQESALVEVPQSPELAKVGALLQQAIEGKVAADQLRVIGELWDREVAREARRKFNEAMLRFQAAVPVIAHNRSVMNKGGASKRYGYPDFQYVVATIRPVAERHGFHFTQDVQTKPDWVDVVTIIRHSAGHEERTTYGCPIDPKGVNVAPLYISAEQNAGKSTMYAQRRGLLAAFGCSTGEDDSDARLDTSLISEKQAQTILDLVAETRVKLPEFLRWMKVDQIANIPSREYPKAIRALEQKRREAEKAAAKEWGTPTNVHD